MKTGKYDFTIQQGADFTLEFAWATRQLSIDTPVNLTGFNARLQIIPVDGSLPAIEWSSEGDNPVITIEAETGKFTFDVPNEQTADYTFLKARYEFEAISPAEKKHRLLRGIITVEKEMLNNE